MTASRRALEAQAHALWLREAQAEAARVQKEVRDKYGCETSIGVWGGDAYLSLKERWIWCWRYRDRKTAPDPVNDELVRGLLSEKWRDFLW